MLQTRVFALSVLSNYTEVHIIVLSLVARNVFDEDNRRIDIEFLSQCNVERLVARPLDRSV